MDDLLVFELEWDDGSLTQVQVPLSTDDLPVELVARFMFLDETQRVAALLAYRLSIPLEAAQSLEDSLLDGEGVKVAQSG